MAEIIDSDCEIIMEINPPLPPDDPPLPLDAPLPLEAPPLPELPPFDVGVACNDTRGKGASPSPVQMSNCISQTLDFECGAGGPDVVAVCPMRKRVRSDTDDVEETKSYKRTCPMFQSAVTIIENSVAFDNVENRVETDNIVENGIETDSVVDVDNNLENELKTDNIVENGVEHIGDDGVSNRDDENEDEDEDGIDCNQTEDGEIEEEVEPIQYRMKEFEILDDIELDTDVDDDAVSNKGATGSGSSSDESEGYFDLEEIDAMLDDGMTQKKPVPSKNEPDNKDSPTPLERQKVVLVEKGHDPFEVLPEGWVSVTHDCGMPVYLHKQSRVCTLSKPYFLGPGSVRKHDIPLSAIPCLQYRKELNKEEKRVQEQEDEKSCQQEAKPVDGDKPLTNGTASDINGAEADKTCEKADPTQASQNAEDVKDKKVQMIKMVPKVKIQSVEEKHRESNLLSTEVQTYCKNLFQFRSITVKRFNTWKDRRKHQTQMKKLSRPTLPSSTKLITCPPLNDLNLNGDKPNRTKEFVLNPSGKSYVCILHEYMQHAIRVQPKYTFQELDNAQNPFSATVLINDIPYGTGYASSKKRAKVEAAKSALATLIPEMSKIDVEMAKDMKEDFSFFDEIKIEDPRVLELCTKAGQPSPYQILLECLQRNYGMMDTSCNMSMKSLKHQTSEFTMTVGKHSATVVCKNKREGKQLAAQSILQLLHPHINNWGSLLRLYGKNTQKHLKWQQPDEESVTQLQVQTKSKQVNTAILNKLHKEMLKLKAKQDPVPSSSGYFRPEDKDDDCSSDRDGEDNRKNQLKNVISKSGKQISKKSKRKKPQKEERTAAVAEGSEDDEGRQGKLRQWISSWRTPETIPGSRSQE